MIAIRAAKDRGATDFGWLDSRHSFSFGEYHDPRHMGFSVLRVINDDRVKANQGFGKHPHQNMEILSYVLEGELAHQDSLGNGSVIRPGDLQRMTAGTGVVHSEKNPSPTSPVHFLQIWILPEQGGLAPGYEQKAFPAAERVGAVKLLASRTGEGGSVTVHQDMRLHGVVLETGQKVEVPISVGRKAWVQVARGSVEVNGQKLVEGDGAAITDETKLSLIAKDDGAIAALSDGHCG